MSDLRVELNSADKTIIAFESSHRSVGSRSRNLKIGRRSNDLVSMAHPDSKFSFLKAVKKDRPIGDSLQDSASVFAFRGPLN